SIPIGFQ
ncbi:hypothetical protein AVEN_151659-1, partial [Araneus ventricosus]